jgi:DNA-nicking Smr family endonuclease
MTGPRPRRPRRLTEEERRLWASVADGVEPLRRGKRKAVPRAAEDPVSPSPVPDAALQIRMAARAPARPKAPAPSAPALAPLARRERQRLARGSTAIDGRMDLHGMTQAQAHGALQRFLAAARDRGATFVLVITGKGGATGEGRGVLRRQVPLWLALPEFRALVAGFEAAHLGHGGEGALYVRLRRKRGAGS